MVGSSSVDVLSGSVWVVLGALVFPLLTRSLTLVCISFCRLCCSSVSAPDFFSSPPSSSTIGSPVVPTPAPLVGVVVD